MTHQIILTLQATLSLDAHISCTSNLTFDPSILTVLSLAYSLNTNSQVNEHAVIEWLSSFQCIGECEYHISRAKKTVMQSFVQSFGQKV